MTHMMTYNTTTYDFFALLLNVFIIIVIIIVMRKCIIISSLKRKRANMEIAGNRYLLPPNIIHKNFYLVSLRKVI